MNIITTILLVVAGIITLLLLVAFFMKKDHYVNTEIVINAPSPIVFDYLRFLKNHEAFNKNAAADADRKKEFKGTDGTAGYIYSWSGDKSAGVGEKEIKNIIEGKKIETEIRFTKPMKTSATMIMEMESLPGNQTKLSWSNAGHLKYPFNIFIPMMQKHVAKDMNSSLVILKNILENK